MIFRFQVKADLTALSFEYSGPSTFVTVTDKNGNGAGVNSFSVSSGSQFEVTAQSFCSNAKSSGGSGSCSKFSSETRFTANGITSALHTSCSQPIFVGQVINLGNGGTLTITNFRTSVRYSSTFLVKCISLQVYLMTLSSTGLFWSGMPSTPSPELLLPVYLWCTCASVPNLCTNNTRTCTTSDAASSFVRV